MESSVADETAADREKGLVDLVAAVVADEQPFELVEPGKGALDDPADAAKPGAVLGLAAGDERGDAALADEPTVLLVVVAAVGDEPVGTPAWPADGTPYGWHLVEQRDQLGDVVAVTAGHREGERDPCGVDQEMVF